MSTWSKRGKSSVPYVWTAKDQEYEHGGKPDGVTDPRVTTYRIKPGALPGAGEFQPGKEIAIKLDDVPRMGEPWTINRFYPADEFDWEELTGDALTGTASCQTIGELCQKLFALDPRKYPDQYYNFEKATPKAKHDVAAMLFEYWDNTAFRYAVTKDGFDWSLLGEKKLGAPGIAAVKADLRLRWVLVKKPTPIVRAVAPGQGAQSIVAPPAVFEPLAHHAREIEQATDRARALLDQSAVYVKERTRLAHQTTALRVLLQTAASARVGDSTQAVALASKARDVEQAIFEKARTAKLPELLGAQKGAPSAALSAVMRRELGYVDDIAAALASCRDGLCSKLLDDGTPFARHVEEWLTWVIDKKQQQAQPVQAIYTRLAHAAAGAFSVFTELDVSDAYAAKVSAVLDSTPEGAFTDPRKVGATAMHKLGAVLGRERPAKIWPWLADIGQAALSFTAHAVIPNINNAWGNLAGPPSLSVAWLQFTSWRELQRTLDSIKTDADAELKMKQLAEKVVKLLDGKGTKMPDELRKKFLTATEAFDRRALNDLKKELIEEFSGARQSTPREKVGALAFQILSLVVAWSDFYAKLRKGKAEPVDYWVIGAATAQGGTSVADVLVTVTNKGSFELIQAGRYALFQKGLSLGTAVSWGGMIVAGVGGVIGLISAAGSVKDALAQDNYFDAGVAGASAVGNLFTVMACGAWMAGAPIPGLNVAGLVLVIGAGVVATAKDEYEKAKTHASKITVSLVHQIRNNPFYESFAGGESVRAALADLATAAEAGDVQKPPNNDFVRRALANAGFDLTTIDEVVDHSTAPIFPGLMPQPG